MKWRVVGLKGALAPPQSVPHMRDITGTGDGSELPVLANSLVPAKICLANLYICCLRYDEALSAFLGSSAVTAKVDLSP